METDQALAILKPLAEGIDPYTGEVFQGGVFQNADTVRALYKAVTMLEQEKFRDRNKTERQANLPANAGKPWTDEEEKQLGAAYDAGESIPALCKTYARTKGSITARLFKLGKIEQNPYAVQTPVRQAN